MTKFSVSSWLIVVAAIASSTTSDVDAFSVVKPQSSTFTRTTTTASSNQQLQWKGQTQSMLLHAEERAAGVGAVSNVDDEDDDDENDDLFDKVELLGKGAAKVCTYLFIIFHL